MTQRLYLAAALAAALGAGSAVAQYDLPGRTPRTPRTADDPKPVYKYELTSENSEYLVCVRTFLGKIPGDPQPKELAEGMAEWIRSECRLYAYVHERGWLLRRQRDQEKEAVVAAKKKYLMEKQGLSADQITPEMLQVKMARIPDEYAVMVAPGKGSLKTMDEAIEFAKYVHKLPCPPAEFCDAVMVGSASDVARRQGESRNPFPTAMPGRNPTLPPKAATTGLPRAELDFMLSLNAGQPYSLIHKTTKPVTLVVQVYGTKNGVGQLVKPGEVVQTSAPATGELLERAAQQANNLAEVLRHQNPPFDAYVLHTRYESYVCVGEYNSKDDDDLIAISKRLAGLAIKDKKTGQTLETLIEKPQPAAIPRP
jgi:hypothetical protein